MDSSANLVSERGSGCAPQNSNGTFEEPMTSRADSKRARTEYSSNNGDVSTRSVLKGSFFALQIMAGGAPQITPGISTCYLNLRVVSKV